jgi:hypothetical protein
MRNFVTPHYYSLTHFKVRALCSKKHENQLDKQGSLHCDYNEDINSKVPHKRPQSIIIGLDPFSLLYWSELGDKLKTICGESGHAVLFTSSLWHAGGFLWYRK